MTTETPRLTRDEWVGRYKRRLIDRTECSARFADEAARSVTFAELSDGYDDDPEGAADMEMSYWDE